MTMQQSWSYQSGGLSRGWSLKEGTTVLICEYCGIHNEMCVAIQCTCSTTLAGAAMGT